MSAQGSDEKIDAVLIRNAVPILFKRKQISERWPCTSWSTQKWSSVLCDVQLPFRVHARLDDDGSRRPQWENCPTATFKATFEQFLAWQRESRVSDRSNPFAEHARADHWAYSSYNYLSQLLDERQAELLTAINWTALGFQGAHADGRESTLWIGSTGAATPCHQDTYDYNLVAQLMGRKRWVLFPPEDSKYLYPTRIPYEESSVFSSVNVALPDFEAHPLFKGARPYIVTLEPGDVLYVPHQWWHYVQVVNDAPGSCVSVNTWLPLAGGRAHLQEALVKFLAAGLFPIYEPRASNWMNSTRDADDGCEPAEEALDSVEALELLRLAARACRSEPRLGPHLGAPGVASPASRDKKASLPTTVEPGLVADNNIIADLSEARLLKEASVEVLATELDWTERARKIAIERASLKRKSDARDLGAKWFASDQDETNRPTKRGNEQVADAREEDEDTIEEDSGEGMSKESAALSEETILNAILSPDVIALIAQKLCQD